MKNSCRRFNANQYWDLVFSMMPRDNELDAFAGKPGAGTHLGRDAEFVRVPVPDGIESHVISLMLPVQEIIKTPVFPIIINHRAEVVGHRERVGEVQPREVERLVEVDPALAV